MFPQLKPDVVSVNMVGRWNGIKLFEGLKYRKEKGGRIIVGLYPGVTQEKAW